MGTEHHDQGRVLERRHLFSSHRGGCYSRATRRWEICSCLVETRPFRGHRCCKPTLRRKPGSQLLLPPPRRGQLGHDEHEQTAGHEDGLRGVGGLFATLNRTTLSNHRQHALTPQHSTQRSARTRRRKENPPRSQKKKRTLRPIGIRHRARTPLLRPPCRLACW